MKAKKRQFERTPDEYEQDLLRTCEGQLAFRANRDTAERLYRRALSVDPSNYKVHRGLGFLYERAGDEDAALREFREYVRTVPDGDDRARIRRRIEQLERRGTR